MWTKQAGKYSNQSKFGPQTPARNWPTRTRKWTKQPPLWPKPDQNGSNPAKNWTSLVAIGRNLAETGPKVVEWGPHSAEVCQILDLAKIGSNSARPFLTRNLARSGAIIMARRDGTDSGGPEAPQSFGVSSSKVAVDVGGGSHSGRRMRLLRQRSCSSGGPEADPLFPARLPA